MPVWWGVAGHIVGIEKIGLVTAGTSNPLPAQVVAGEVTVKQVSIEPVCGDTPVNLAHVNHVTGQPHAGVVVQVAGLVERLHGLIDDGNTRCAFTNVDRHMCGIGLIGQRAWVQGTENTLATHAPDMAEVLAPAELVHQLVLRMHRMARSDSSQNLWQADNPMRDVRRQAGDCAIQEVSGLCVGIGLNCIDQGPCG